MTWMNWKTCDLPAGPVTTPGRGGMGIGVLVGG